MFKIKNYNTVFYRMLFSFFLVFIIPYIIFINFSYSYFTNTIKKLAFNTSHDKLIRIVNTLNIITQQIYDTERSLSQNVMFTPLYLKKTEYAKVEVTQQLNQYISSNNLLFDIILSYSDDNTVYSSYGKYTLNDYMNDFYTSNTNIKYINSYKNTLPSVTYFKTTYFPSTPKGDLLVTSFPMGGINHYGTVSFFIKSSVLDTVVSDVLSNFQTYVYFINDTGNIVYTNNSDSSLSEYINNTEIQKQLNQLREPIIQIHNNKYYTIYEEGEYNISYLLLVPYSQLNELTANANIIILFMLFLILLLGIVLIIYVQKKNYSPIKVIVDTIHDITDSPQFTDELEHIKNTVDTMISKNNQLMLDIKQISISSTQNIFGKLLTGSLTEWESINSLLNDLNLNANTYYYTVATLDFDGSLSTIKRANIITELQEFEMEVKHYVVDMFIPQRLCLIVIQKESFDDNVLLNFFTQIQELYDTSLTIGISNCYTDIKLLSSAYFESVSAADYDFIIGAGEIIFYKAILSENEGDWYPLQLMNSLSTDLEACNMPAVRDTLDKIFDFCKAQHLQVHMYKKITYDIANQIIRAIHTNPNIDPDRLPNYDLIQITEFKYVSQLKDFIFNILEHIEQLMNSPIDEKLANMKKYIENHFSDFNFTVTKMADDLSYSTSYLMRYFKENTNLTIYDYVTNIRILKAKDLLISTKDSISEVAMSCGYADTTSFIRNFKKIAGFTPGQYRNLLSGTEN